MQSTQVIAQRHRATAGCTPAHRNMDRCRRCGGKLLEDGWSRRRADRHVEWRSCVRCGHLQWQQEAAPTKRAYPPLPLRRSVDDVPLGNCLRRELSAESSLDP